MRKQYSCDLLLGAADSALPPSVEQFAHLCREWAGRPGRAGVTDLAALPDEIDLTAERQSFQIGEKANLAVLSLDDDEYICFGVRLTHPDSRDDASAWTTDICYSSNKSSGQSKASVTTTVARTTGVIRPMFVQPSRPTIVKAIVEKWEAQEEVPIRATANVLTTSDLPSFIDLLQSPQRRLPVLFISARNFDDKPIVNGDEIADQVIALCHVYVSENRFPSLSLTDRLGHHLN